MDPLRLVEDRVGDVESWPTFIILHRFVEEPNARTVKNISTFMFGNNVPIEDDVNCGNACNGLNCNYVAEKMYEWYYKWQNYSYRRHIAEYYDMRLKCLVWTNGWERDKQKKVPGASVYDFGLENSGCPQLILCAIANVREESGQRLRRGILFV
jgi:hypothetical protein